MVLDFGCNLSAEEKKKSYWISQFKTGEKQRYLFAFVFFPPNSECFLSLLNY